MGNLGSYVRQHDARNSIKIILQRFHGQGKKHIFDKIRIEPRLPQRGPKLHHARGHDLHVLCFVCTKSLITVEMPVAIANIWDKQTSLVLNGQCLPTK